MHQGMSSSRALKGLFEIFDNCNAKGGIATLSYEYRQAYSALGKRHCMFMFFEEEVLFAAGNNLDFNGLANMKCNLYLEIRRIL